MFIVTETQPPRTDDSFIRTFTGAKFWPLNPRSEEVCIDDIAHALSLACRFTGHTYCSYSVAEHSLHVSKLAESLFLSKYTKRPPTVIAMAREVALWGLMHDASEGYLCDLPSPLKRSETLGRLYKGFERELMQVIAERFDLWPHEPIEVKDADRILLNTEMFDLMGVLPADHAEWNCGAERLPETIYPFDAQKAETEFMRRFEALMKARNVDRLASYIWLT